MKRGTCIEYGDSYSYTQTQSRLSTRQRATQLVGAETRGRSD